MKYHIHPVSPHPIILISLPTLSIFKNNLLSPFSTVHTCVGVRPSISKWEFYQWPYPPKPSLAAIGCQ